MNSFKKVRADENNPKWEQMIKRESKLYSRDNDLRSPFERDYTRILHSKAYRKLKHKTQVFYSPQNDNICTRIEHVNYVESISHTIAKALELNTDLTRAIAIAHDVGHAPFGHKGGVVLSVISQRDLGTTFWHEKNSLYMMDNIQLLEDYEENKRNINLTYAVRDGIISHCGEIDENAIKPREEAIDLSSYTRPNQYEPYTWEGAVVKISDKISYIGRDLEDAKNLGLLEGHEDELYNILGRKVNNTIIINDLIVNLCNNSSIEKGLIFSKSALDLMDKIKAFNYKYIYGSKILQPSSKYFEVVINQIYDVLKNCYDKENTPNRLIELKKFYPNLISNFLSWINNYWNIGDRKNLKNKILYDINKKEDYLQAIITYISGMTDKFAIDIYNEIIQY